MRLIKRRLHRESEELNITAFMNLMVILVPFLLITAVFSRLAILELNIPSLDAADNEDKQEKLLELEVVVRESAIEVQDGKQGLIKRFEEVNGEIDWNGLTELLVTLKSRFPDIENAVMLLESDIDYQMLIKVMDHIRAGDVVMGTSLETVELFPEISIGDAPRPEQEQP